MISQLLQLTLDDDDDDDDDDEDDDDDDDDDKSNDNENFREMFHPKSILSFVSSPSFNHDEHTTYHNRI